jgi:hypothetical protein
VNAERRSLAEAFKPAAQLPAGRGTSLEGILSPKRKQATPAEPARSTAAEPTAAEARKETPKPAREPRPKVSESGTGAIRNVGVYLPPGLLERVKDTVRAQQSTYADLLVEAFDMIDESALARAFEPDVTVSGNGMPRRVRRTRGVAGIQINVRLDDQQVRWVDAKIKQVDAPSRSALITAVYKLYLEQHVD